MKKYENLFSADSKSFGRCQATVAKISLVRMGNECLPDGILVTAVGLVLLDL